MVKIFEKNQQINKLLIFYKSSLHLQTITHVTLSYEGSHKKLTDYCLFLNFFTFYIISSNKSFSVFMNDITWQCCFYQNYSMMPILPMHNKQSVSFFHQWHDKTISFELYYFVISSLWPFLYLFIFQVLVIGVVVFVLQVPSNFDSTL